MTGSTPQVRLVARLLRQRRGRSAAAGERYALTMLGYAFGCRRQINVAPVRPPVKTTTPRGIQPVGRRHERVFDAESTR